MKTLRLIGAVLLAATVLLLLGVLTVAAAVPPGSTPMSAIPVDNTTDPIAANSSLWYRFDYALDTLSNTKPLVTLTLVNALRALDPSALSDDLRDLLDDLSRQRGVDLHVTVVDNGSTRYQRQACSRDARVARPQSIDWTP